VLGKKPLPVGVSGADSPMGVFDGTNSNTVTLTGIRAHVDVDIGNGRAIAAAQCRFYGLTLAMMNQLSVTNLQFQGQNTYPNALRVEAGDAERGMALVFNGFVFESYIDAMNQPDVALCVQANAGGLAAVAPSNVLSYRSSVDIATIVGDVAERMGWSYETNGVSVILQRPYLWGSPMSQLEQACRAANVEYTVDSTTNPNTLAIWPKGRGRGTTIPLVSPRTGMVASPQFSANGISVTTEFNPAIRHGQYVQVESMIVNASGKFYVQGVHHTLDALAPGGAWFTTLTCTYQPDTKPGG
jgi:hypothetical protein